MPSTFVTGSATIGWIKKLLGFTAGQSGIQALSVASGILLVHLLSKEHYAWFTIANAMGACISVLSDGGVSVALTARAGAIWQDRGKFGSLISAGLRTRRQLVIMATALMLPWTLWLLHRNGAPLWQGLIITVLVCAGIWPSTTTALINVISRMHGRTGNLLAADAWAAFTRLGCILILVPLHWLGAVTATLAASVSQIVQYVSSRRRNLAIVDWREADPAPMQAGINQTVRQFIPNGFFSIIQGNLSTWLIGVFATTTAVADVGALSRLSFLFVIIGTPVVHMIGPAFSRCQSPSLLVLRAVQIVGAYLFVCGMPVLAVGLFPEAFLWLLGAKYGDLRLELLWTTVLYSASGINQLVWGLVMAKGWIQYAWLQIPLTIGLQILFLKAFTLNTIIGVAQFGLASTLPPFLLGSVTLIYWLRRGVREETSGSVKT